ncbi:hypothetical protein QOY93_11555 [Leclercia adecarboxylata]|uniref:hypothetical protein n=1 Tax=Leclercia adecarboxylata TaxID=83655 RepID=UPI00254D6E58|nr:hypothetical protein [Leclercia adecarboxylata]MDK4745993.1 hypothetical protein [Leclercia adecarboxylata]
MKKALFVSLMALSASALAGNCTYPDDIAADGSVCGGRAASVRPGGYEPPPEYAAPQSDSEREIAAIQQADKEMGIQNLFCQETYHKWATNPNGEYIHLQWHKDHEDSINFIDKGLENFTYFQNEVQPNGIRTTSFSSDVKAMHLNHTHDALMMQQVDNTLQLIKAHFENGKISSYKLYACPLN